jgi:(S)-3,5-dihydroxyphenylglycine transaminase
MRRSSVRPIEINTLHDSLLDPAIGSMSFLNEVANRYPQAISFAPGAPNLALLKEFDIPHYLSVYLTWLAAERGLNQEQARHLLLEYGPSAGIINPLIAHALDHDYMITAQPSDIVITVGAQEAMLLVLRVLCRPEQDVLALATPSYVGIIGAAKVLGLQLAGVPEQGEGLDLGVLSEAIRAARDHGRRVRALYVAPDFANPSGTLLSERARMELLRFARENDFYIIEDSTYGFSADPAEQLPSLKSLDEDCRVVYLGTFAKIGAPGARVGFLIADQSVRGPDGVTEPLAAHIATIKSMITVNTSPICQAIVGGLLLEHGGSLRSLAAAKTALYRKNLNYLLGQLHEQVGPLAPGRALRWTSPKGGFFVRMRLPVRADMALMQHSAADFGVLWTPMSYFYLDSTGDSEIRLSCSYLSEEQIHLGVSRLALFLRSLHNSSPKTKRGVPGQETLTDDRG